MFEDETRVLMILPRDLVDRARELAGRTTTSMKMPVSLQIVFRARSRSSWARSFGISSGDT